MTFDQIMNEITSGLTGNSEDDIKYLIDQLEKYKTSEYAEEILRAVGRMIYKLMPDDKKEEVQRFLDNVNLGIEKTVEEAEFQMYKNNYKKALEIIEPLIKKLEKRGYKDDTINEYHCFDNIFEEIIYKELFKPTKDVRPIPENYTDVYFKYGIILFELKKYDEARKALEKANKYNPISTDILFELSETYKVNKEWDEYLRINNDCLKYAYSSKAIARCYRNYGFYFIEQGDYDMAEMLFFVSLNFDNESKNAQSELMYISNITGKPPKSPKIEEIIKTLEKYNIQFGANQFIVNMSFSLGKIAQKNKNNSMAENFYKILYDLIGEEKAKHIIDSVE